MNIAILIIGGLALVGLIVWISKKRATNREATAVYESMKQKAFPNGQKQIEDEASKLYLKLDGRLNLQEAKNLIAWAKALLIVGDDITPKRMYDSISRHENGKLNDDTVKIAHSIIVNFPTELYPSGNGSYENMVHINTNDHQTGIHAEYRWIRMRYGERDVDWKLTSQINGKKGDVVYDQLNIMTNGGEEYSFYFNITKFFKVIENTNPSSPAFQATVDELPKTLEKIIDTEGLRMTASLCSQFFATDYTEVYDADKTKVQIVFANIFVTLTNYSSHPINDKLNYLILAKMFTGKPNNDEVWQMFNASRDFIETRLRQVNLEGKSQIQKFNAINAILVEYLHDKSFDQTIQEQLLLRTFWEPINMFVEKQNELDSLKNIQQ